MGLGLSRKPSTGSIPVWQGIGKDIQLAQGGFALVTTGLRTGDVIKAGTPGTFDESSRTATVLHVASAYANAASNAVNYQVAKGHTLVVGDYLASGVVGGKAYAITAIDTTTSTAYDVITVGTTIGAVTAGDGLYASTATGATASALPTTINGLVYDEIIVSSGASIDFVIRGTVYARRIPYTAASLSAITGLKNIIFSQSL